MSDRTSDKRLIGRLYNPPVRRKVPTNTQTESTIAERSPPGPPHLKVDMDVEEPDQHFQGQLWELGYGDRGVGYLIECCMGGTFLWTGV